MDGKNTVKAFFDFAIETNIRKSLLNLEETLALRDLHAPELRFNATVRTKIKAESSSIKSNAIR